jgi:hypothetical protein
MIVTGVAQAPISIRERNQKASLELVFLAVRALEEVKATRLITNLAPGWDQALVKAALELELPYTVTVPGFYPVDQNSDTSSPYRELLGRAREARRIMARGRELSRMDEIKWRVRQADLLLVLWDFDFESEIFQVVSYTVKKNKTVVNLWREWEALLRLRRNTAPALVPRRNGAQIFESKRAPQTST